MRPSAANCTFFDQSSAVNTRLSASSIYEQMILMVTLAAFTITGLRTAIVVYPGGSAFFFCFLAVITACGGGLLRDVMAQEMPAIFVKKIYAVASLAGALTSTLLWQFSPLGAFIAGATLVVLIRFLAMHFRWNLPRA